MCAITIAEFEARFLEHIPGLTGVKHRYAVLVPLVEWNNQVHILFEVRADTLKRQPGEVCFPGGRLEGDEGPTACAIRETGEELGIPPSSIRPIARLDDLYMPEGGLMHPVLAQVDTGAVVHMKASPAEVKETFLVPADFFVTVAPEVYTYPMVPDVAADFPYEQIGYPEGYPWRTVQQSVPVWRYRGHAIWGLTARILRWNLHRDSR